MRRSLLVAALTLAPALAPAPVSALTRAPAAPLASAGVDEHLGARLPLDLAFTSASGDPVRLGSVFADGKPVVLTLAYYHCSMLCPLVLRGTAALATRATPRPRADYHLLTVSIDPRDRPADARKSRADLLAMSSHRADDWRFWTGSAGSIRALTDAVGFRYAYDAKTDQFAHAAVTFVLTPDGRVSRYLYGIDPPREEFEAALSAAAAGESGSSFERVILRCFHYFPALRRYGAAITGSLRGAGLVIVLSLVGGLALLTRRVRGSADG